jgi:dihydrolipoamide dehydrogenase
VKVDDRGFVTVDAHQRTTEDGVYAVGDVVATPQLAHVGFAEAIVAVRDMLGEDLTPVDYGKVPWCIYCHPEVAFAGMTEQAARDAGHDVTVAKHSFIGNSRALIVGEPEGLVKVIAEKRPDGKAGPILGVHMVGPWVTEQLGEGWLSVNWEATPDDMGQLIHPHPTLSETFGETVLTLTGRGLHG